MNRSSRLAAALLAATAPAMALALDGITDRPGDFLSTFAGSAASTDLDVISATVLYDPGADLFKLTSTFSGDVGLTASALYVWGVNRGAGTAGFAAQGIDGVRFDRVVLLRPDGSGSVAGVGALADGSVTVSGATITALVPGALLESTGFAKRDYTWNLWPRDASFSGFAAISDFAPDNANFTTTIGIVPEPGSMAMMLAGLVLLGGGALRRGAVPRG
ncbi:PEP-CTERM sorting domain-containing protein [Rubrivivax gelatinosus]|uniref:Ice-binding protein C-terminal domain-containing protein n=1 Tax=Rubrivivax gelatinosus (strain NBRC 100245 / IL144) TaxID=983917 RepID=I0HTD3_RUBGI|nr:PEP-CTERM sorting domain-containing protein [Rubrivivax gelatinosus]BAL96270.1 hypothetical protein RGE_29310 [Rubrivivax gelatinosus IL144]